jgi:hypothetical protein
MENDGILKDGIRLVDTCWSIYLPIYTSIQIKSIQIKTILLQSNLSTSLSLFLFVSLYIYIISIDRIYIYVYIYTHPPLYTLGQTNVDLDLENPWFPVKTIYKWWGKPHKFKFTLG